MANQRNNQHNDNSISQSIKNTAGSAFETVHNALEATENAAMKTVDAASNAVSNLTENRSAQKDGFRYDYNDASDFND
ncbi:MULTISPECIES: hypothetical protein [Neobacillus]|uniref:Uncharacterized protein n=1 Tax=Neobacillus citreus TaxID=2833578 RepID=A0A942YCJ9_9BACI|nr:hypothetical protein [Neobacillus citreus]MCH6264370.1 hypothetical protein [Neobacillus citreus]